MSQTYKKNFARTVSVAGAAAVSLATLLLGNGWAATDSMLGEQVILTPTDTLYLGDDENVRDVAGVGTYQGIPLNAGDSVNLADYRDSGSIADPNSVWFYSALTQSLGIAFSGV